MTSYAQRTIAVLAGVIAIALPLFHYLPLLYVLHAVRAGPVANIEIRQSRR
jgi:hypothetical protein